MKKWVYASEIPEGYFRTSKFIAQTDEQRNALEAFEIAVTEKFKQFDQMCAIQTHLTSDSSWSGVIDEYPEGYYIQLDATRSGFQAFVQGDHVIRKPRKLSEKLHSFNVDGNSGTIYFMSSGKIR